MSRPFKNMLHGVGSVLDVSPRRKRLEQIVGSRSTEEWLGEVWRAVGKDIATAMGMEADEQTSKREARRAGGKHAA